MQPMSFEQFEDWGREQDRADQLERAEDQIAAEQQITVERDLTIAEQIATGLVCWECGAAFQTAQGIPTVCADCGGIAPVTPWRVGGRYLSDPTAAHAARLAFIARRRSMVARIRRVEAERGTGEASRTA